MQSILNVLAPVLLALLTAGVGALNVWLKGWVDLQRENAAGDAVATAKAALAEAVSTAVGFTFQTVVKVAEDRLKDGEISAEDVAMIKKGAIDTAIEKTKSLLPAVAKETLEIVLPNLDDAIVTMAEDNITVRKLAAKAGAANLKAILPQSVK